MNARTDQQLLREYAGNHSEAAFAELVRRHVDLVYSAALRMVRDSHQAEDVTQGVFVALAQNAPRLTDHPVLSGWLHRTTQNLAANAVRANVRRQTREQEAVVMNELLSAGSDASWEHIAPQLDAALGELSEPDRDAVLLRYFEKKSAQEMAAVLGVSSEAAQKRVNRAVERLREFFAKRGVTVGASGLAAIFANAVQAAPVALATTLVSASLAGAAAANGTTLTILKLMTATKLKLGVISAVIVAGILVVFFLQREGNDPTGTDESATTSSPETATELAGQSSRRVTSTRFPRREQDAAPLATPEEVVAGRLSQYGRSRRSLAHELAQRHGVEVPDSVKRFFDAVESGNWDEIDARFKVLAGAEPNASVSAAGRPSGLEKLWPAIIDAYGAAEQAHLWPAQQYLDYGNAVLDSLRPGMVYVGGSDNGRWIPEMLNDTSDGEHHVVITQNGLADASYLDYLSVRYGDRLNLLTGEESQRAFQEYVADVQKRLQHDQEFPDEPRQIRPGEEIQIKDGLVQVSGTMAVMDLNERILQALMQKNPGLSFAAQESFPMRGTYTDAVPLGPLMELGAADGQNAFTADRAAQSVEYWRTIAQKMLSDPLASGSSVTLWSYSHDVNATANLLAARNFDAEAEQAYRLASQLMPSNIEAAFGLSGVLTRAGRMEEARQVLNDFSRNHPDQKRAIEASRPSVTFVWTAPAR